MALKLLLNSNALMNQPESTNQTQFRLFYLQACLSLSLSLFFECAWNKTALVPRRFPIGLGWLVAALELVPTNLTTRFYANRRLTGTSQANGVPLFLLNNQK